MLNIGQRVDAPAGADATFLVAPEVLLRHAVFLGASGSGKTVASKVLIEEMLRSGIPAIVVDPQGDLASLAIPGDPVDLAKHGLPDEVARGVLARSEVVVWTPGSEAGIPLGIAPLSLAGLPADPDARAEALGIAARAVCNLLGLSLEKDEGKAAEAAILLCVEDSLGRGQDPGGFDGLAEMLENPSVALALRIDKVADESTRSSLAKKIRRALIGSTGRLFDRGVPLDIDVLLGRDERLVGAPGAKEAYPRTRCSVIYLNSLQSSEEKEFFLAELVRQLLRWMFQHPSDKLQCLFFVDEVAPFLPPVRKPACRDALRILVKQARKYGIGCVFATQNPGDVDYKSLGQCSTWGLGRVTVKQDLKKLDAFLKGMAPDHAETIQGMLPARPAGELLYLAPDVEKGVVPVRTRWLATAHRTLDLDEVKKLVAPEVRKRFEAIATRLRANLAPPPRPAVLAAPAAPAAAGKPPRAANGKGRDEDEDEGEDADVAPSELEKLEPRVLDVLLREIAALTADEVAAFLPDVPAGRVRRALKEMGEEGALRREKCGRSFVHWHPKHVFDLERRRLRAVWAAEPRIVEGDARSRAQHEIRTKLFVIDLETLTSVTLRWLPLYRCRVRSKRQKGFFVKEDELVAATLYLHPRDLRVLELSSGNQLRFVSGPREKAEDVQDLDEVTREWKKMAPGLLSIPEALEAEHEAVKVESALKTKFTVSEVLEIDVVHVPYWEYRLENKDDKSVRVGAVDALLGSPFQPEAEGKG